jgi:hypothetical protein
MSNLISNLHLTKTKIINDMYKNIKSNKETKEIKYIEIKKIYPLHGSVQNYYHFMMSVFIPILLDIIECSKKGIEPVYIFNTNFGPMLRILMELPINIKFRYSDIELCQNLDKDKLIEQKLFKAYDMHPNPNILKRNLVMKKKGYGDFLKHSDYTNINKWMNDNIKKYDLDLVKKYDILIIERKVHKSYEIVNSSKQSDDKSYNNKLKELFKHSGKELRSIINHKEFVKFIKNLFPKKKVLNISLEYTSIFDQYKLFNNAKLIFCQHGASLSNIIFMKKDTQLVEIINKSKYDSDNWFVQLSKVCKIKHHQYVTDEAHVNIDLDDFKMYLEKEKIL